MSKNIIDKINYYLLGNRNSGLTPYSGTTKANTYALVTIKYNGQKYMFIVNPKSVHLTIKGTLDGFTIEYNTKTLKVFPSLDNLVINRNDMYLDDSGSFGIKQTLVTLQLETIDLDEILKLDSKYLIDDSKYFFSIPLPNNFSSVFTIDSTNPDRLYIRFPEGSQPNSRCIFNSKYDVENNCILTNTPSVAKRAIGLISQQILETNKLKYNKASYIMDNATTIQKDHFQRELDLLKDLRKQLEKIVSAYN